MSQYRTPLHPIAQACGSVVRVSGGDVNYPCGVAAGAFLVSVGRLSSHAMYVCMYRSGVLHGSVLIKGPSNKPAAMSACSKTVNDGCPCHNLVKQIWPMLSLATETC